jgi:Domain of unknown function (DUF4397)
MKKSVISIRSVLPVLAAALFLIPACSKDNNNNGGVTNNGSAFVSVTNASGNSSLYNVYNDSTNLTTTGALGFGTTTGTAGSPYETISTGAHHIKLSSNGTTFATDTSINFTANQHYSVFAYDTATGAGGLKTLVLSDNINTAPANGQAAVRFLPLSPNTTASSIWLINGTDTISLRNLSYIGNSIYNNDSLAAYSTVSPGTYQVVVNNAENINLVNADSVSFVSGKFYTLYSRGYSGIAGSDSLSVGVIQQN